ncbi:MAG: hypothetical protein AMXMBFR84_01400 [Candidatus Hydrogenedentota bacterium]
MNKSSVASLFKIEDWWAVWLGFALLASVFCGAIDSVPSMPKWAWGGFLEAHSPGALIPLLPLALALCAVFALAIRFMEGASAWKQFVPGFVVVFMLASLAYVVSNEKAVKAYDISYAFWALGLGMLVSNTFGAPAWLMHGARTEFYIKTGLVVFGADILLNKILAFSFYGVLIAWGVTPVVIVFMWFYGTRFLKMTNKPLVMVIAAATSVCGVSAAIAAGAACKAKKDDLTMAIGMSLIFTVIMMIAMPAGIRFFGLDEMVGGAWMGNTIDSTGAVVAAGAALGENAEAVAGIVKMIQNILIGVIAFGIALFWVTNVERDANGQRPSLMELWTRFPKFILGFLGASIFASLVLIPFLGEDVVDGFLAQTNSYRNWLFCMAFVSIGLESNIKSLTSQMVGGKPFNLYIVGQVFSLVLSLLVSWLVLSGVIMTRPNLLD